jgi:hypothetical protein
LYRFLDPKARAAEDPSQLQSANVAWIVTDSSCRTDWDFAQDPRITRAASVNYKTDRGDGTLTLWAVQPNSSP